MPLFSARKQRCVPTHPRPYHVPSARACRGTGPASPRRTNGSPAPSARKRGPCPDPTHDRPYDTAGASSDVAWRPCGCALRAGFELRRSESLEDSVCPRSGGDGSVDGSKHWAGSCAACCRRAHRAPACPVLFEERTEEGVGL
jgi:hypothetical protein